MLCHLLFTISKGDPLHLIGIGCAEGTALCSPTNIDTLQSPATRRSLANHVVATGPWAGCMRTMDAEATFGPAAAPCSHAWGWCAGAVPIRWMLGQFLQLFQARD